eukprot:Unigene8997_Nuclearia_a/m.27534 Unigene8997_Nuclearia_a/g.27534  ORF Unigene8997_Nuclearia_a/g.27534 Unigene8997_Nuclearia_a/m.27534 type:complete len:501 (+) Unigene8997_Nuclearia_a:45-1547(+)
MSADELVRHLAVPDRAEVAEAARMLRAIAWDKQQPDDVVRAGAIKPLVGVVKSGTSVSGGGLGGAKRVTVDEAATAAVLCLRSLSYYNSAYRRAIHEAGGLPVVTVVLRAHKNNDAQEHAALMLANCARDADLRALMVNTDVIKLLIAILDQGDATNAIVRAVHAIYFLTNDPAVRDEVAKENTLKTLLQLHAKGSDFASFSIAMVLANVLGTEDQKRLDKIGPDMIGYFNSGLQDVLQGERNFFSAADISCSIQRIAAGNALKESIGRSDVLKQLLRVVTATEHMSDEDKGAAVGALWALAFLKDNKERMLQNADAIEAIRAMAATPSHPGYKNALGCLWEIDGTSAVALAPGSGEVSVPTLGHVMLSYNWNSQPTVLRVKEALQRAGYTVWIDVEQMRGSTLEAMAKAVEDASVILVCASRLYLESPNCRSEADYAFSKRKDIVPLIVEKSFKPVGWLGMIIGTRLALAGRPLTRSTQARGYTTTSARRGTLISACRA